MNDVLRFFNNKINSNISMMAEAIRKAFKAVKIELDDHLEAINQNTAEIQANQGFLTDLDAKINKIAERLDDLELLIHPEKYRKRDVKLTPREQEVFMSLYLGKEFSTSQVAKQLGFTEDMAETYLFNLLSKGVPVRRELVDDVVVFSLDPEFKDVQTRRNVLDIDPRIAKQLTMHHL